MNKKYVLLSVMSGVLMAFSYPNFIEMGLKTHTFFFIWFAYVPLVYVLINETSKMKLFFYGMISWFVFNLMGLYWLCNVKPMGAGAYVSTVLLALYLSLFMGAALALSRFLKEKAGIDWLFGLPAVFTVLEFVREWFISGFTILTPAQSQYQFISLLQMMSITGVYGPAYLILFVNTLAAVLIVNKAVEIKRVENIIAVSAAALMILSAIAANFQGRAPAEKIRAAVIQPNDDQDVEWSKSYKEKVLLEISGMIKGLKAEKPDIVVWPETEYPGLLNAEPWMALEISGWLPGAYSLVGADAVERGKDGDNDYYNSAFLINPQGIITGSYAKVHLVPFGEYIPLQNAFPFIKAMIRRAGYYGFSAGKKIEPMDFGGIKTGPLICYDSLFPEIAREYAGKGAVLLVHLSYEAWYGRTPASSQIFTNTAMRCIENRLPLVRSVSTGMSGFISDRGEIYSETGLFGRTTAVADVYVDREHEKTLYTRFGDWFPRLLALLLAGLYFNGVKRKK